MSFENNGPITLLLHFFSVYIFPYIISARKKITYPLLVTLIISFHIFFVNPVVQGHWVLFL